MKRILAFICVMACLCGLCLPAMAAPDVITITAQVPEDWTNVHLYTWIDETNNLAVWPGTPMNKTDDGRYTLEIPSGYPYVIINNGGAGNQTVDTSVDGISDTWLIVTGNGNAAACEVLYYDPGVVEGSTTPSTPNEPAALTSMALVGEGNDALKWEPDNSACDMTKSADGVYTKDLTMYKDATIKFKLCGNDSWDGGYNFGASAPDMALTAGTAAELVNGSSDNLTYTATQDCTLTVTLDMNGEVPTVTLTETAAELAPPPEVNYVKVYVSAPEGVTPSLWAWGDNGNAFPSWPGQTMTKSGDWWVVEIPDNCHSALVNDGSDANKTADLSITTGADNWIVVGADWTAQTYASEPSLEDAAPAPDTDTNTDNNTGADTNTDTKTDSETKEESEGGVNIYMIITIVMAVAAVAAVIVTVIIISKKKKQ